MSNQSDYIKREDVKELIRAYCKDLIERDKDSVEVLEFNRDIQKAISKIPAKGAPPITLKDKEKIELSLGRLEAVALVVEDRTKKIILDVIDVIESILDGGTATSK